MITPPFFDDAALGVDLWTRIQLTKLHYQMGTLSKEEFLMALNWLYEAAKLG